MDIPCETRRNFIEKTPVRAAAIVAVLGNLRKAFAADVQRFAACTEENSEDSILTTTCHAAEMMEDDYCNLLGSMRDAPAFEELALKLPNHIDLRDRKLTVLYPASGTHLAPLLLASKLIDGDFIDEAVFTCTEISAETPEQIIENLNAVCLVKPQFKFHPAKVTEEAHLEGRKFTFPLEYSGKKITIILLLNCCGTSLFPETELEGKKIVISHDCIDTGPSGDLKILEEMFYVAKKRGVSFPAVILGDSRRHSPTFGGRVHPEMPYGRNYDLEAFGRLDEGTKPYGHRNFEECGILGKELGRSAYERAAIFEANPEILGLLDYDELILLADLLYKIKNTSYGVKSLNNEQMRLGSFAFFEIVVAKFPAILEKLNRADPRIVRAVAWRVLQSLYLFITYSQFETGFEEEFGSNPKLQKAVKELIAYLEQYLQRADLFEANRYVIPQIRATTAAMAKAAIGYKEKKAAYGQKSKELYAQYGWDLPYDVRTRLIDMDPTRKFDEAMERARVRPSFRKYWRTYSRVDAHGDRLFTQ